MAQLYMHKTCKVFPEQEKIVFLLTFNLEKYLHCYLNYIFE